MSDRYRVVNLAEARRAGLPIWFGLEDHEDCYVLYDFSVKPPVWVGDDRMQPEDALLVRDLAWVPRVLNELDARAAAAEEKLAKLREVCVMVRHGFAECFICRVTGVEGQLFHRPDCAYYLANVDGEARVDRRSRDVPVAPERRRVWMEHSHFGED